MKSTTYHEDGSIVTVERPGYGIGLDQETGEFRAVANITTRRAPNGKGWQAVHEPSGLTVPAGDIYGGAWLLHPGLLNRQTKDTFRSARTACAFAQAVQDSGTLDGIPATGPETLADLAPFRAWLGAYILNEHRKKAAK